MSEPEIVWCPKCHQRTATIIREADSVQIKQGNQVMVTLSGVTMKGNTFKVRCPNRHLVTVKLGEDETDATLAPEPNPEADRP